MNKAKRRVGLLVDSLVGGGAERMSLNFAEKLIELGHDAHVMVLRNEIDHDIRSVPVHILSDDGCLSRYRPINKILLALRLRQLVAKISADGHPFDFFISNSEDMDRISKLAGLRYVFIRYRNSMLHFIRAKIGKATGFKRHLRTRKWFAKFRRIYGNRHIITVSQAMQVELMEHVGLQPRSIRTIYNPFNFERIVALSQQQVGEIPHDPYIIYVARISGRKDQETLIHAFALADPKEKLVLLGGTTSDSEREYEQHIRCLINQLGLRGRVLLPGFHVNPYPWIKHARLFVMSSRSEGLPLVLVEAMILGVPVVSTDCPTGPSELLTGELATFLSPPGDVSTLAANISRALSSYPPMESIDLTRFSDDYAVNEYLTHYNTVSARFKG